MNWKECGRKRLLPDLKQYPDTCFEGLRKSTKDAGQDIPCPSRDAIATSQIQFRLFLCPHILYGNINLYRGWKWGNFGRRSLFCKQNYSF
jgi:hypothetical protein